MPDGRPKELARIYRRREINQWTPIDQSLLAYDVSKRVIGNVSTSIKTNNSCLYSMIKEVMLICSTWDEALDCLSTSVRFRKERYLHPIENHVNNWTSYHIRLFALKLSYFLAKHFEEWVGMKSLYTCFTKAGLKPCNLNITLFSDPYTRIIEKVGFRYGIYAPTNGESELSVLSADQRISIGRTVELFENVRKGIE